MKKIRLYAVLEKQGKEILRNPIVLGLYLFFTFIAFILTKTIAANNQALSTSYFPIMFTIIFCGIVPLISIASIIAEEKEKNTMRVLIMAGVRPFEYLLGISIYLFVICILVVAFFGLIGGVQGSAIGIALPIGIVIGYFPMIAGLSNEFKTLQSISLCNK